MDKLGKKIGGEWVIPANCLAKRYPQSFQGLQREDIPNLRENIQLCCSKTLED